MLKTLSIKFAPSLIDKNAIFVINQLNKSGFNAYLVGGCVRDLLLGVVPKDFDIVSDATPKQIKSIFKRSRIILGRFCVVHILFASYRYLEVSTFRSGKVLASEKHHKLGSEIYGTIDQDVQRRDFSINALYYDIHRQQILDYVGGLNDIKSKTIRVIGTEKVRYQEDPVRLLRAVRFSVKLDFFLSTKQQAIICQNAALLQNIFSARLYEESLKLFHNTRASTIFKHLVNYGLLPYLFPYTSGSSFVILCLENTSSRLKSGLRVSAAFFLAVFLWQALQDECGLVQKQDRLNRILLIEIAKGIIAKQLNYTSFARYISRQIVDIWLLQYQLEKIEKKHTKSILTHPRFRAAYDFLLLRSQSINPELKSVAKFWQVQENQRHNKC